VSLAPGQTVWCSHRGRVRTRERFAQVRINDVTVAHSTLFWVQPPNGGPHTEFVAVEEDLGTLDELNRRWPAPVAKQPAPEPAAAVEQMALFG
jgi:hypothetical protein